MAWTYKGVLDGIHSHINNQLTTPTFYKYIGIVPLMSDESDYKNFSAGKLPAIGVAMLSSGYQQNGNMGYVNPVIAVQVTIALRQSGSRPDSEQDTFLDKLQELQAILLAAERSDTPFSEGGLALSVYNPTDVLSATILGVSNLPSFVSSVDQNRKGFSICNFSVELNMSDI